MNSAHQAAIIDADLAICDPHHHLWDTPKGSFAVYHTDELNADRRSGHNVVSTVFVECGWAYRSDGPAHLRSVGETVAAAAAGQSAPILGIVSSSDLTMPVELLHEALDAHTLAGDGRFRGIRDRCASHPSVAAHFRGSDADKLTNPDFRRGLAVLAERGLSFDAWLFHPQIPTLAEIARELPNLPIVLDHLGGPLGVGDFVGRRDDVMAWWRGAMADLATCANVSVKLGGFGMAHYGMGVPRGVDGRGSTPDEMVARWAEHVRFVIDTFGPERCMFESNYPVDGDGADYVDLWNAFKLIAAPYSAAERRALFHDTAVALYRVG